MKIMKANTTHCFRNYMVIVSLALVCNINTLFGTFVFDDVEAIVKNKDVYPSSSLTQLFNNDFWGTNITSNLSHKSYRPLTTITYRWNAWFSNSELKPLHFHIVNVLLYILLCVLTLPVAHTLLERSRFANDDTAFLCTVLFTLHPIHTEVVAGLVGRADLLGATLFLIAFLVYVKTVIIESLILYLTVIILALLATFCKETSITILIICCIYELLYTKDGRHCWRKFSTNSSIRIYGLFLASLLILGLRLMAMNFQLPTFTPMDNPATSSDSFFTKVFTYNYVYFLNVVLLLWPQWLCFDWSMGCIPLIEEISDIRISFVIVFWIILGYFVISIGFSLYNGHFKSHIPVIMSGSFIIIPFLPASNLFMKVGFVIAERILLLPSLGFCLLVTIGFKTLAHKWTRNGKFLYQIFYITCLAFGMRTIERNANWITEEMLFQTGLSVCPLNAKVHYNVAKVAADSNIKPLALLEYRRAIELNPNYEQAMNNLANLLRDSNEFDEAENLLRRALAIRPNFAAAWMNLGIVLTHLDRIDDAEQCYLTAILHRPKYPDCYYNLGNLYLDRRDNEKAISSWEKAVQYKPSHRAAWSNMLVLLDSMQQYEKVLQVGREALKHNPSAPSLHFSLGNTLGKLQNYETAEKHFLEAVNLSPHNALYYSNLGVLYHRWHKTEKAIEMYKKALQIEPNLKTTTRNLRKLMHNIP